MKIFKGINLNKNVSPDEPKENVYHKEDLLFKESDRIIFDKKKPKLPSKNDWLVFDCCHFTQTPQ